jgi:hypothetical protein
MVKRDLTHSSQQQSTISPRCEDLSKSRWFFRTSSKYAEKMKEWASHRYLYLLQEEKRPLHIQTRPPER